LVLLRARLVDFQKWGIELLVMQLYDQSKAVSLAAIAILGEAVEEKVTFIRNKCFDNLKCFFFFDDMKNKIS
jgi:hypothetical protein